MAILFHTDDLMHNGCVDYKWKVKIEVDENKWVISLTENNSDMCTSTWSDSFLVNSLDPGKSESNFKNKNAIFSLVLLISSAVLMKMLRWMLQNLNDHTVMLVQAMAWCHQATSHYLSQCWSRSLSTYVVTRPQWVNFRSMTPMNQAINPVRQTK